MDAASWITTLSTLGLFLAAVVAGFLTWRTFRAANERDRRAQAVQIGAWTATLGPQPQGSSITQQLGDVGLGQQQWGTFGLCLLNDSSLPVTDFVVLVPHSEVDTDPQRYLVLPPGFYFAPSAGLVKGRYGHFERFKPMERGDLDLWPTTVHAKSANVVWFSFVDATGQRWTRWLHAKAGHVPLTPGGPPGVEPFSTAQLPTGSRLGQDP